MLLFQDRQGPFFLLWYKSLATAATSYQPYYVYTVVPFENGVLCRVNLASLGSTTLDIKLIQIPRPLTQNPHQVFNIKLNRSHRSSIQFFVSHYEVLSDRPHRLLGPRRCRRRKGLTNHLPNENISVLIMTHSGNHLFREKPEGLLNWYRCRRRVPAPTTPRAVSNIMSFPRCESYAHQCGTDNAASFLSRSPIIKTESASKQCSARATGEFDTDSLMKKTKADS